MTSKTFRCHAPDLAGSPTFCSIRPSTPTSPRWPRRRFAGDELLERRGMLVAQLPLFHLLKRREHLLLQVRKLEHFPHGFPVNRYPREYGQLSISASPYVICGGLKPGPKTVTSGSACLNRFPVQNRFAFLQINPVVVHRHDNFLPL